MCKEIDKLVEEDRAIVRVIVLSLTALLLAVLLLWGG